MLHIARNLPLRKFYYIEKEGVFYATGKSVSEALIFESVNPQYDARLFNESPKKYKFRTCFVQILFWMSKQKQNKNNFCTQHVLNSYFFGEFNEQSLFKLWVNWCKNDGFWKRFTCTYAIFYTTIMYWGMHYYILRKGLETVESLSAGAAWLNVRYPRKNIGIIYIAQNMCWFLS